MIYKDLNRKLQKKTKFYVDITIFNHFYLKSRSRFTSKTTILFSKQKIIRSRKAYKGCQSQSHIKCISDLDGHK